MNTINESDLDVEKFLAEQIEDGTLKNEQSATVQETIHQQEEQKPKNEAASYLGTKLGHKIGGYGETDKQADKEMVAEKQLSRIGESIKVNSDIRDGWMEVDKNLLGERAKFYPTDWQFRIRPANVEAIRNWSTIDDENPNSIDDVFNEILKSCLSIVTPNGPLPWGNIRSWDRFFFILLIREYTFIKGESKVEFTEDCPNCDNPATFTLSSLGLDYELPDQEVLRYYSVEEQNWLIDPEEFGVAEDPITLYLPTLEKDANIKAWIISRVQEKKKVDNIFIRFLTWMAPKISKDLTVANRQIREYEMKYKAWDTEMFSLMDEVIRNISIIPATKLKTTCPVCGEEVTTDIRFPNGVRSLFSMANKHKKFGTK